MNIGYGSTEYVVGDMPATIAEAVRYRLAMVGAPVELREDPRPGRVALATALRWRTATDRLIDQVAKQEAEKTNV